ncbi:1-acylglycerol-3-phosphate O-acyltransferase PNPLA3 isoform X2 [Phyllostomus hastatus]|uniref:1-acylglycerol-3-phosphate O-acyltransferase PNPLA3 isoform X2 n=1 Tax=Phyllostomus hastatus TaxID=9423 RepID=UPI001E683916|nr:1-acylglycerol-3-phosphate O-acyltransferase PNPLA3 isoform X2 [Phyllostomus hastatus]
MYDPKNGWNLSFAGCGFLGFYHIGVTQCLGDRAPHLLRNTRMFFGASSGSLHCVSFVAGVPSAQVLQVLTDLVLKVRSQSLGILQPCFSMNEFFREALHRHLPANVHELISGKVGLSLTRVSDWENVLVSDFQSKEEVVDAVLCSCFIPFVSAIMPPSFRGERYVDGGFTNSVPFFDTKTTITVSPFYGECDICPKAKSTNFFHVEVSKLNFHFCLRNCRLVCEMLCPPDLKVLRDTYLQGYLDAARFLEKNGLGDRPLPRCPSLSPEELEVVEGPRDTRGLEAPWEGAGWRTRPEGDELLNHLCHSLQPWDQGVLQTVSPELTEVLSKMVKARGGYLSKICSSLPAGDVAS